MKKLFTIALFCVLGLSTMFAARNEYLVVNLETVFNGYTRAQEAQAKLQEVMDAAQVELDKQMQEGVALVKEFEELQTKFNNPALTEDARQKYMDQARPKAEEIQRREAELNEFRREKQAQFGQRRQAMLELYLREISDEAAKLAKSKGVDSVVNSTALVYFDEDIDITDELVRRLND